MKITKWRTAVVMLCVCGIGCASLTATVCAFQPKEQQKSDGPQKESRNAGQEERQALDALKERVNKMSMIEYRKIKPELVESIGPGATDSALRLDQGVTFSSIPIEKLVAEGAPGKVANEGLESLSQGGNVQTIFPITVNGRVQSQLIFSWNRGDDTLQPREWSPNRRSVMTEQVENARRLHSKATETPLSAYKGVSFFGLNKHFLYVDKDGKQEMIPIERDPAYDFVPGKAEPAKDVMKKLKEMINKRKEANAPS